MLDVLVIATRRPEILERTLSSFRRNMFGQVPCRCIVNVDPVGESIPSSAVVDVCEKYFTEVVSFKPDSANFGVAFKTLWHMAESEFAFNLEEDWELNYRVDIDSMLRTMIAWPRLASLRLPYKAVGEKVSKNWKFFFPWNGSYFECPKELKREVGFCGHPSLIRTAFMQRTAPYLDARKNPEKQFHGRGNFPILKEVDRWEYGVFAKPNSPPAIRDIGRQWMVDRGWRKSGAKAFFTAWERADDK